MIRPAPLVLLLSIVGYPLVAPLPVFLGLPSRLVSVPFRAVVVGVSLWVIASRVFERRPISVRAIDLCFALFWVVYVLRIAIDVTWVPAAVRLAPSEYFLFAIGVCLLPAVAVRAGEPAPDWLAAAVVMMLAGTVAVLCNAALVVTSADAAASLLGARAETGTFDPISFSHLGVSTSLLGMWILSSPNASRLQLGSALLGLAVGLLGAILGASRGPLLMVPVMIAVVAYRLTGYRGARRNLAAACLLALLAGGAALVARFSDSLLLISRLRSLGQDEARAQLLADGWAAFRSSPFEGAGIEPLGSYPHNLVLESFMAFGLLTGTVFVILLLAALFTAFVRIRERAPEGWVSLLFLQYALGAMVSGSLYAAAAFWVLMSAVLYPKRDRAPHGAERPAPPALQRSAP